MGCEVRTVYLAGGIGSGKSTVARELEALGAVRIDLDQLSREVLEPPSELIAQIADAFGSDLVDAQTGALNRGLLAQRAFATAESGALLEELELPAIRSLLAQRLEELAQAQEPPALCVVEVPLLDRMGELDTLADEVLVVSCPLALRRERAIQRGMTASDFDARAALQPTDEWLAAHATTLLPNEGSYDELCAAVRAWYEQQVGEVSA